MAESQILDGDGGDMTKMLQKLQERAHFVVKKLRPSHVAIDTNSKRCILNEDGTCEPVLTTLYWNLFEQMIPVKFIDEHSDKIFQIVKLRSRVCAEPIKVRLFIYDYRPRRSPEILFGTGWKDFATRNELSLGDSLIFELIGVSEFKVHIFRGGKQSTSSPKRSKNEAPDVSNKDDGLSCWASKKRRIGGGASENQESSVSVEMKRHDFSFHVENRLINMEIRLINMEIRLTQVENRLIDVENRLINVENRLQNKTVNSWSTVKEEEEERPQPSFVQRLEVHNVQDAVGNTCGACFEIPVGFVKTLQMKQVLLWLDHGKHVKLQGIREGSPVRAVTCAYKITQLDMQEFDSAARTMSGLSLGWGDFVRENGLRAGQVLVFTLVAASFFTVRELR